MTTNNTNIHPNDLKIAAQVAVEAIINTYGDGYDLTTMQVVREVGTKAGVDDFYLDPLRILISERG